MDGPSMDARKGDDHGPKLATFSKCHSLGDRAQMTSRIEGVFTFDTFCVTQWWDFGRGLKIQWNRLTLLLCKTPKLDIFSSSLYVAIALFNFFLFSLFDVRKIRSFKRLNQKSNQLINPVNIYCLFFTSNIFSILQGFSGKLYLWSKITFNRKQIKLNEIFSVIFSNDVFARFLERKMKDKS